MMLSTEVRKIYVIEGQGLFGKALCQVFSMDPGLKVVGENGTAEAALIAKAAPDVILLDLDGHQAELEETMTLCKEAAPNARVCVLSLRSLPEAMERCLSAGVEGYILKDITPSELMRAVKSVADGMTYVDPRVAGGLLRRRTKANGRRDLNELSMRETEIVKLIAEGLSNKEISSRLTLSEKTVKNHISHVFSKLNICARTQAAVYAIKAGLV
jgi:DNA-binding NarL/FixJ family response regulator